MCILFSEETESVNIPTDSVWILFAQIHNNTKCFCSLLYMSISLTGVSLFSIVLICFSWWWVKKSILFMYLLVICVSTLRNYLLWTLLFLMGLTFVVKFYKWFIYLLLFLYQVDMSKYDLQSVSVLSYYSSNQPSWSAENSYFGIVSFIYIISAYFSVHWFIACSSRFTFIKVSACVFYNKFVDSGQILRSLIF